MDALPGLSDLFHYAFSQCGIVTLAAVIAIVWFIRQHSHDQTELGNSRKSYIELYGKLNDSVTKVEISQGRVEALLFAFGRRGREGEGE